MTFDLRWMGATAAMPLGAVVTLVVILCAAIGGSTWAYYIIARENGWGWPLYAVKVLLTPYRGER